ncbi:hypothetical protein B0H17DRAFT_1208287 [Mycena rosella]|uniref:Uncharacterized protein n=1 Tax=Mycena rosella TaxID=1033263 RepID=A0AAD7D109_MYCRO|nr:hypothetical protein B0H17DRAFT_1208287 [Mycena rosella]
MTAILSAAQSVASLSLRSSAIIGITPALTLPTTPLPNLTSLFLEGICFSSEDCPGCPESFVLMHAAHLAHLTLIDCPLYGHERLSALLSVSIHGDTCLFYTYEDMGWGLITLDADEFSLDGSIDRLALEELVATLEARNLVKEE